MANFNVVGFRDINNTGLYVYYSLDFGIFSSGEDRREAFRSLRKSFIDLPESRALTDVNHPDYIHTMRWGIILDRGLIPQRRRISCLGHILSLYHFDEDYSPPYSLEISRGSREDDLPDSDCYADSHHDSDWYDGIIMGRLVGNRGDGVPPMTEDDIPF